MFLFYSSAVGGSKAHIKIKQKMHIAVWNLRSNWEVIIICNYYSQFIIKHPFKKKKKKITHTHSQTITHDLFLSLDTSIESITTYVHIMKHALQIDGKDKPKHWNNNNNCEKLNNNTLLLLLLSLLLLPFRNFNF